MSGRWVCHHRGRRRDRGQVAGERYRSVGSGLRALPRVGGADAAEDLTEPFERCDRASRKEVVDVGVGRTHPAGERLVTGCPGERVQPDEAVAVAPQTGRLGCDERGVASIPAIGYDDHDATRSERATCPCLVEGPEALADPRPTRPVVDRFADLRQRPIAILVAEQPRDAGEPRPEHERLGADGARGRERLDEPQQQPRVALHRARDVADHDERARLSHGRRQTHDISCPPVPRLRRNIARGARRRPCEWSS